MGRTRDLGGSDDLFRRRQQKLLYVLAVRTLKGSTAGLVKMRAISSKHLQKPQEPVMGIEPMTPVLPRLCATAAPHGQAFGWAVRDSNPRSRRQLIYSQPQLATLVTAQSKELSPDVVFYNCVRIAHAMKLSWNSRDEEDRRRDSKTCYIHHKKHTSALSE